MLLKIQSTLSHFSKPTWLNVRSSSGISQTKKCENTWQKNATMRILNRCTTEKHTYMWTHIYCCYLRTIDGSAECIGEEKPKNKERNGPTKDATVCYFICAFCSFSVVSKCICMCLCVCVCVVCVCFVFYSRCVNMFSMCDKDACVPFSCIRCIYMRIYTQKIYFSCETWDLRVYLYIYMWAKIKKMRRKTKIHEEDFLTSASLLWYTNLRTYQACMIHISQKIDGVWFRSLWRPYSFMN